MDRSDDIAQDILRNRERGAARLVAAYRDRLYAAAFALCRNAAESEDLVFRTFERVVANIGLYEERDSFFNWMYVILVNLYRNSVRGKTVRNTLPAGSSADVEALAEPSDAAAVVAAVDGDIVRQALEKIPADMREVLILRYFMDLPVGRIAKILSMPVGSVKSRLFYARAALRVRLTASCRRVGVVLLACALAAGAALTAGRLGAAASARAAGTADEEDGPHDAPAGALILKGGDMGKNLRQCAAFATAATLAVSGAATVLVDGDPAEARCVTVAPAADETLSWDWAWAPAEATEARLTLTGPDGAVLAAATVARPAAAWTWPTGAPVTAVAALAFRDAAGVTLAEHTLTLLRRPSPSAAAVVGAATDTTAWKTAAAGSLLPFDRAWDAGAAPDGAPERLALTVADVLTAATNAAPRGFYVWKAPAMVPPWDVALTMGDGAVRTAALLAPGGMVLVIR